MGSAWLRGAGAKLQADARRIVGSFVHSFTPIVLRMSSALLSPEVLAKLESLDFVSRRMFQGRLRGERRSTRKGRSVEFADYRNYVQGDDLRFVDWNILARLDRLFVKLFLEE